MQDKKSREPNNFKVRFESGNEGLERIAAAATEGTPFQWTTLAHLDFPEPLAHVRVNLAYSTNPTNNPNVNLDCYMLSAYIHAAEGEVLAAEPSAIFLEDFEARMLSQADTTSVAYELRNRDLPASPDITMRLFSGSGPQASLLLDQVYTFRSVYSAQQSRWAVGSEVKENAKAAISAFANALELAVNNLYTAARKPAPSQELVLAAPLPGSGGS